ncbi:hypothetical protein [Aquabacterium sp.]|uniref:hypothetical protein n=1 Tax=Aquabacterium sp. TaxID=1872578 RepID=UPI003783D437
MSPRCIAEQRVSAFCRAKDGNRPHLMGQAFAEDAWLETVVDGECAHSSSLAQGREAITRALVRHFGRHYENVYTFCLQRPGADWVSPEFSCDWLTGMSSKDSGQLRIACGRYDWRFQQELPFRVQGLKVTIMRSTVLPPSALAPVTDWLDGLPYPWCPAAMAVGTAPALAGLQPVLARLHPAMMAA